MNGPKRTFQPTLDQSLPFESEARTHLKSQFHPRTTHGGPASRGKRKTPRPFIEKAPLHLVLSSQRAKGSWSLEHRKHRSRIQSMIYTYAERFRIKVYRARIEGGQIQLLIKAKDRKGLADFLRVLAGRVAVRVTGAQKLVKRVGKFWNELCWSRLVNWGGGFFEVSRHLESGNSLSIASAKPLARLSSADAWQSPFPALTSEEEPADSS